MDKFNLIIVYLVIIWLILLVSLPPLYKRQGLILKTDGEGPSKKKK